MKQQYFRAFAAAMAFSAVLAVFRLETRAFVRFDAQRGNASVLIDFRASAPDSQPVVDLKAEDVSIKIDGRSALRAGGLNVPRGSEPSSVGDALASITCFAPS